MWCPRCDQGYVVQAIIVANNTSLFVCQECEASWFSHADIGNKVSIDFGTYMEGLGLKPLWIELKVIPE